MSTAPNSVFKGVLLTVSMRWVSRLIGLVSTLILARLLVPDDFGITAMAAVVLGLMATLLDLGINVALVRNAQATPEHYHSAWTMRLMQAVLIAAVLAAVSPFAGDYFRDPRVTPVLMLMALNVVVGSLENIGIITFQKEMQFGREFRFVLINRVVNFACTVSLALALRSYWALVLGTTLGTLFSVAHSYVAHPMRPRLCVAKLRELFAVSQWMLVQNIGGYFDLNLHKLLVGRRDDTATMGAYSIASDLASMPSSELLQPLNRVLFPTFVAIKHDLSQLRRTFLLAQSLQVMVAMPAAIFLSLLAVDLVPLLLGPQWGKAVPLLEVLALGYALNAIQASAWYVSITLGQERRCAAVSWSQIALFLLLALVVLPGAQADQIARLRVIVSATGLGFQLWIAARALGDLGPYDMVKGIWRTAFALGVTIALVLVIPWPALSAFMSVLLKASFCIVSYAGTVWLLWRLSSRPEGAEVYIADRVTAVVRRLGRKDRAP